MTTVARCLRVLVVDDEPLIRWSIAETLGAAGHQVTEAQEAASTPRRVGPDGMRDLSRAAWKTHRPRRRCRELEQVLG